MPTRSGWTVLGGAVAGVVIGRVFGIIELYVIAAGAAAALVAGLAAVRAGRSSMTVHRWIHPPILTVGDVGRVDLAVVNTGRHRSPRVTVIEPVGARETARLTVAPLRPGQQLDVAYRLPVSRRGVLELGPLELERRDQLGLALSWRVAAPLVEVVVAPRTHEIPMPDLGRGVLGRHLLTQAQRTGSGEFHSLRDYIDGDEPKLINWRASARSDELKVRQHTTEGVRRCIVVLDCDLVTYGGADGTGSDAFERAVTAAASLVEAGDRAGLTTRFVTAGGIDLRGPEVAASTLRVLARIVPGAELDDIERDPGSGLGLVVVVTSAPGSEAWRRTDGLLDPTLTRVGVFTGTGTGASTGDPRPATGARAGAGDVAGRLSVDASSVERFVAGWEALAGRGGLDVRSRLIAHAGARS